MGYWLELFVNSVADNVSFHSLTRLMASMKVLEGMKQQDARHLPTKCPKKINRNPKQCSATNRKKQPLGVSGGGVFSPSITMFTLSEAATPSFCRRHPFGRRAPLAQDELSRRSRRGAAKLNSKDPITLYLSLSGLNHTLLSQNDSFP